MSFIDNQIISIIGSIKRQIDLLQQYFVPSQLTENLNTDSNPFYQEILSDYEEELSLTTYEPHSLVAQSKQLEPKLKVFEDNAFILEKLNRALAILETPPSHEKTLVIYHQIKTDTQSLSKDFLTSLELLEEFKKVLKDIPPFKKHFLQMLILSFEAKLLEDPKQYQQSLVAPLITCIRQIQNVPAANIEQCYQFLKKSICSNPTCIHPSVDTTSVVNSICTTFFLATSSPTLQDMLTGLTTSELTPEFFEHIEQIRTAQITLNSAPYRGNDLESIFATRVLAEQDRFSSLVRVAERTALTNPAQEAAIQYLEKKFSIPAEIRLLLEDDKRTFVTLEEIYPIIKNEVLKTLDPWDDRKGLPPPSENLPLNEQDKINQIAALLLYETNKKAVADYTLCLPFNAQAVEKLLNEHISAILNQVDESALRLKRPSLLHELIARKIDTPILNKLRNSLSSEEKTIVNSFISEIKKIKLDALTEIDAPTVKDRELQITKFKVSKEISPALHQIFSQCHTAGKNALMQLNDIESKRCIQHILKTIVIAVMEFFHLKPATGFFSSNRLEPIAQFQEDLDVLLATSAPSKTTTITCV